MKKVFKSILLLIALCLPLLGQRVSADVTEEPLQVVVQHQFENPDGSELVYGADIALSLYDISKQYQAQETPADAQKFIESFSQLSAQQLRQYLADNKIKKVETVTTDVMGKAHFKVAGNDNAYLIVQDQAIKGQTILPLAFSLPLQNEDGTPKNTVELYTKPVKLTSCAYFYKYGVNGDKQIALADAQFVLGQEVAGEKQYLAIDETSFVASDDPANDTRVKKFTSDEQGLVLHDSELAPGQYFFSEVKAPNGYSISEAAKRIAVTVADDMQITVAGVQLVELVAGMVPSSFTTAPKILNYAISEDKPNQTPTVPTDNGNNDNTSFDNSGPKGSSVGGMLAQLGEKKGLVSLIGILLVSFAVVEFIRQRKKEVGKMKNKLKALFMSLLLVASVLIPSLASAKTVNEDENIPENVNITVHKRVFKDGNLPGDKPNTGDLMPDFGGEALPNVGFTVYDITEEYIKKLAETKDAQTATDAMVNKYTDAKPATVAAEQKLTDKNGDVTFEGLATKVDDKFKTYIVLETKSPSAITTKSAPMVLTMPMYAYDDKGEVTSKVLENIHVYPKNAENEDSYEGKLTKELLDDTVHHHTNAWGVNAIDDMILSPRVGRLLQYKVTYNVPATTIFDADNGLTIVDDPGIGIVLPEKVAKDANGKAVDTIVDSLNSNAQVANVVATYNGKTVDAEVKHHEDKQQGGNSYFEMKITGEQNADLAGETLEITYYAYLAKTEASMDDPVDNKVTVTADTTKDDQTSTEGETTRVTTPFALRAAIVLEKTAEKPLAVGGYNFQKIDAQSGKALAGAKFVVFDTETDNPKQSGYVKFNKSANGRNDLKWVKDSSDATVYTSDKNGRIKLDYLPYGDYKLVEIEAPTGYAKGEALDFKVAKDTYQKTENAPIEVKNAKKGLLPSTGGYGIYIFLVIGLALMGGAYVWFRRVRKNDNV